MGLKRYLGKVGCIVLLVMVCAGCPPARIRSEVSYPDFSIRLLDGGCELDSVKLYAASQNRYLDWEGPVYVLRKLPSIRGVGQVRLGIIPQGYEAWGSLPSDTTDGRYRLEYWAFREGEDRNLVHAFEIEFRRFDGTLAEVKSRGYPISEGDNVGR